MAVIAPAVASGPDWASIMTAVGTVAVAVVAVGVALFAEWRADKRVTAERVHAATVLADERAAADARLKSQQEHSGAQLREERQRAQDAEQQAEAWAVEVIPDVAGGAGSASYLTVDVFNLGSSTITRVEAEFSLDGRA